MSPSSLLAPAYELTIGSQRWTTQATAIALDLHTAPLIDVLRARFPFAAPLDAAPDDPVVLALDGGEGSGPETVFTGQVGAIARGPRSIVLTAFDAGAQLASYRPATTFEQATAASVIRALCDDAGASTGSIDDGPTLAFYAADPSRTALEHVARVADWGAATVSVDADGNLQSTVINGAEPELALRFGREPITLTQTRRAAPVAAFVVAGEGGGSSPDPAEALRPSTDFFAGDRPDGPSPDSRWSFEPALRTAEGANTAGAARLRTYQSSRHRTALDAWLLPALRPGTVVSFEEVPDGLARGPFWVERVRHRVSASGATTRASLAEGGEAFDPMALLAGALGGLL
jgi:hypothetical protein